MSTLCDRTMIALEQVERQIGFNEQAGLPITAALRARESRLEHQLAHCGDSFDIYKLTDLGTLPGFSNSVAYGLNDRGQVVGETYNGAVDPSAGPSAGPTHAFLYSHGTMLDLGAGVTGNTVAFDLDNAGHVIGDVILPGGLRFAYRTQPGLPINPPVDRVGILGVIGSSAIRTNERGQMVGQARDEKTPNNPDGGFHAFRSPLGTHSLFSPTNELGTLGGQQSHGYGINASGEVVGDSEIAPGSSVVHAFRLGNGNTLSSANDLGTLGGSSSTAFAINDFGTAVGYSQTQGNAAVHGFRTPDRRPIAPGDDLGTLPGYPNLAAYDINNSGQIIGTMKSASSGQYHAFVDDGRAVLDLNNLIGQGSGWVLNTAWKINQAGQIVGGGTIGGVQHAFLLTPIGSHHH